MSKDKKKKAEAPNGKFHNFSVVASASNLHITDIFRSWREPRKYFDCIQTVSQCLLFSCQLIMLLTYFHGLLLLVSIGFN